MPKFDWRFFGLLPMMCTDRVVRSCLQIEIFVICLFEHTGKKMKIETLAVHAGYTPEPTTKAVDLVIDDGGAHAARGAVVW